MGKCLVLLACLVASLGVGAAAAAEVEDLYAAAVPVPGQSEAARAQALPRALAEVLVRVTGNPSISARPGAAGILDRAASLVQQYGYYERPPEGIQSGVDGGAGEAAPDAPPPEPQLMLRVVFDDQGVDAALLGAGLPVWGRERPSTLLWLTLEQPGADFVTQAGPQAVIDTLQQAAGVRGLPLRFPGAGVAQGGRVTAADIRSGNSARLRAVSRGYGASHLLIGSVSAGAGGYHGRWQLLGDGLPLAAWSDNAPSRAALLNDAVGHAAGVYAAAFAVLPSGGDGVVMVGVDGVENAEDYARVSGYLADLSAVRAVRPVVLDGAAVVFHVRLSGGARVLDRNIGLSGWLVNDPQARNLASLHADTGEALGYRLTP